MGAYRVHHFRKWLEIPKEIRATQGAERAMSNPVNVSELRLSYRPLTTAQQRRTFDLVSHFETAEVLGRQYATQLADADEVTE